MPPHDSALSIVSRNFVNVGNLLLLLAIVFLVAYREANSHGPDLYSSASRDTLFSMAQPSYEENILEIRRSFLRRFENVTYLDFATLPLVPDSAMNDISEHLHTHLFGNPHSESPSAELSTNGIESARLRALKFLGTNSQNIHSFSLTRLVML
jgi:hypothetical protein